MRAKDIRNEEYWKNLTVKSFALDLKRRHKDISRFRFCTRGEIFDTIESYNKVRELVTSFPNISFEAPTRAWRNKDLKELIESDIMRFPNAFIIASIDPSNTKEELETIKHWRTLFFGDNNTHPFNNVVKCASKWEHIKGLCATCGNGCFSKERKHIWLKEH